MNDVAVFVGSVYFFVTQLDLFKVVMLLISRILDVVHHRLLFHVLLPGVEELHFKTRVGDFVPLKFRRIQGLTCGHRLVQARTGRINFLGEQEQRVDSDTEGENSDNTSSNFFY